MLQYSTMDTEEVADEVIDELSMQKETSEHLLNLGKFLQHACPPASRFYMSSLERKVNELPDKLKNKTEKLYCHHCGSIWNLENSIVQVQARPQRNRHIKFLQKLEPWKLNNRQKQKLKKFYESTNKIVFKCKACKKITSFPGSKNWSNSKSECTSTPVSKSTKIKLKKKDLNAGLYIPSPSSCSLNSTVRTDLEDSTATNTSVSLKVSETSLMNMSTNQNDSFSFSNTSKELSTLSQQANNSFEGQTLPKNSMSSEKQPNSSKKKQTLLAQILKQGTTKKKKSSLTSFLVSL